MRRIVWWAMSTLTVLVLLFGYHTSTAGAMRAPSSQAGPITAGDSTGSGDSGGSGDSTGSGSGGGSGGNGGGGSGGSSGNSGGSGDSSGARVVTGPVAQTQWGPMQVQIKVENGTITDVGIAQYPSGNGRDLEINQYALPILIRETLDAQSADIDMVSGATVSSVGYVQSLQGALDQAGL